MSKAFTRDDDAPAVLVRARAPLPAGVPNYVTARGLAALRAERGALDAERARLDAGGDPAAAAALAARLAELDARIAGAIVVTPQADHAGEIRFGASVTVQPPAGPARTYQIVGVDEADAALGRIAFTAPLARALLGRRAGEVARVKTPRGDEEWEIQVVAY